MSLDLAIVCSVHNYGRYLAAWADSLLTLTQRPAAVYLLEHGSTDASPRDVDAAARKLETASFRVQLVHAPARLDFGAARNAAVALAAAHEWVMHFDADDLLMPHALEDIGALAPDADVVALGYRRCQATATPTPASAGHRQPGDRTYRTTQGESTLRASSPASGPSPFRTALWRQRPYRTDMIGGWDTALWLDFAHLGARFAATSRPAFWYRQHPDSVYNQRVRSRWPAARAGAQLQGARRGDAGACLVVPRRPDDAPERQAAWDWVKARYAALHPAWPITEGLSPDGPWCKGAAAMDGARGARGRVMILADADCLVPPAALEHAVALVESGTPWVVPHTSVYRLKAEASAAWMAGPFDQPIVDQPTGALARPAYRGYAGGGIVVVNRALYEAVGGIPEQFVGWGCEDEALALLLDTLVGPHVRLSTPLLHLWHPAGGGALRGHEHRQNQHRLLELQRAAVHGAEALWALVRSLPISHLTAARTPPPAARYPTLAKAHARRAGSPAIRRQGNAMDDFARQRLVKAHTTRTGGTTMAAALEHTRNERLRIKREQEARNAEANAAAAARRETASAIGRLHPDKHRIHGNASRRAAVHQRKALDGSPENKMLPGAEEAKRRRVQTHEQRHTPVVDPLAGVTFASPQAEQSAREGGLTAADLTDAEQGPQGFTASVIRRLVEQRQK